jgi:SAM-dependent methyltransferase
MGDEASTSPSDGTCNSAARSVTRYLGNNAYTIDPYRHVVPWTLGSLALAPIKAMAMVVASPFMAVFGTSFFACMSVGPSWIRGKILSVMIPRIMSKVAKQFDDERVALLADIAADHRVLDVGAGGGAYLKHCARAKEIVALEPCAEMHEKIRNAAEEADIDPTKLTLSTKPIEEYLENNPHEVGAFDWVILGNVLCEVDCQISTLRAVKDALKVGGRAYFSEHVGGQKGTIVRAIQDMINPMWRVVSGGCNCNRDTLESIRAIDELDVISWQFEGVKVCLGPFVVGMMQKK